MHKSHIRRTVHSRMRGFSLVELLVVIGIILMITATVLAQYSSFNSTILLKDLAYEIALSLREAQSYGISVRGDNGEFDRTYGMHFTVGNTYTLFVDRDEDGQFDSDEVVASYTIGNNNSIVRLCANGTTCSTSLSSLDVMYRRPESDAFFYGGSGSSNYASVTIVVGSENGAERYVRVWPTGQISIE